MTREMREAFLDYYRSLGVPIPSRVLHVTDDTEKAFQYIESMVEVEKLLNTVL